MFSLSSDPKKKASEVPNEDTRKENKGEENMRPSPGSCILYPWSILVIE